MCRKDVGNAKGTNAVTVRDKSYTTRNESVWSVIRSQAEQNTDSAKYCNVVSDFTLQYFVFHCFNAWSHPCYLSVCLQNYGVLLLLLF